MNIPSWVTLVMGAAIVLFGSYRIMLSRKKDRRATYLGSKSADLVMGIVHVLAGLFLLALGLGVMKGLR